MAANLIPGIAEYPRDQWYVAAFSDEIKEGEIFHRTLCDDPIALYRKSDGKVSALYDRCPHRGMPLSKGKLLADDKIQCAYHGFEFAPNGQCALVPSQSAVPAAIRVHSYPVVEKWKWIWFWPGDPSKADPSLIPNHEELGLGADGWTSAVGVMLPVEANYLLPYENLADATHITYLHHGLIDDGSAAKSPFVLEEKDNIVSLTRELHNERQGMILCKSFGWRDDTVLNRTLRLETRPPQVCVIANTWRQAEGQAPFPDFTSNLIVMLTPATKRRTLQFVAQSFKGAEPPAVPDEIRRNQLRHLLSEDVVAIETIQTLTDTLPPEKCIELSVKADEGAIRTRRLIAAMIAKERPSVV